MTSADDISGLAEEMEELLPRFRQSSSSGYFLATEDQATFKRLAVEAKSALDAALGHLNDFSINLLSTVNAGSGGFFGGPSYASVAESAQLLRGAINHLRRRGPQVQNMPANRETYIDPSTLTKLRAIKNGTWDFHRLVRMCEELNIANENSCTFSTAMLVRAIVDHIPPVFQQANFTSVANNYASKSIKGSLQNLDRSLRNIADAQLHSQIRSQESVPSAGQVNFRNDLDVLLSEVIRINLPS